MLDEATLTEPCDATSYKSQNLPPLRYFQPLSTLSHFKAPYLDASSWVTSVTCNKSGELLLISTSSKKHNLVGLRIANGTLQENEYMPRMSLPFRIYGGDLCNYRALVTGVCKLCILPLFSPCKELIHHSLPPSMTGRRLIEPQFHHAATQASIYTPSLHSVTSLDLETGKLLWLSKESVASHRWDASHASALLACLSTSSSLSLIDTRVDGSQISFWALPDPGDYITWSPFRPHHLLVAGTTLSLIDIRHTRRTVAQGPSRHGQKLSCATFQAPDLVLTGSLSGAVHAHAVGQASSRPFEFVGSVHAPQNAKPVVGFPPALLPSSNQFLAAYDHGEMVTCDIPGATYEALGHPKPTMHAASHFALDPALNADIQQYIDEAEQANTSELLMSSILNAYQLKAIDLPCPVLFKYILMLLRNNYLRGLDFGFTLLRLKLPLGGPTSLQPWKPLIHLLLYPTMYDIDEKLETYKSSGASAARSIVRMDSGIGPMDAMLEVICPSRTERASGRPELSDMEKNIQRAHACLLVDPSLVFPMLQSVIDFQIQMEAGADIETLLHFCRSTYTISSTLNRMYLYYLRQSGYWDEYLYATSHFLNVYNKFDCAVALSRQVIFHILPAMVKEFKSLNSLHDASTTLLFKQWLLKIGWILKYCSDLNKGMIGESFQRTMDLLIQNACFVLTNSVSIDVTSIQHWIHQTIHTLNHGPFPAYLFATNISSSDAQRKDGFTSFLYFRYLERLTDISQIDTSQIHFEN